MIARSEKLHQLMFETNNATRNGLGQKIHEMRNELDSCNNYA